MRNGSIHQFDRFKLNLVRGCLQDDQADLQLRPKSFEVLCQLVENAGRLMSKDELVRAVWPDVIVSDDLLAHCVRDIRKVLDDAQERFIKTVPRRGYMFVAKVTTSAASLDDAGGGRSKFQSDVSNFEANYRQQLRQRYTEDAAVFVPLAGETDAFTTPETRPTRATHRRRGTRPEYHEWLSKGEEIARIKLGSLRDAVDRYPCVILLGDPGCGKTATLENMAFEFSAHERWLPVPLHLGAYEPNDTLEDFIVRSWIGIAAPGSVAPADLTAILQQRLESGGMLLLLDALNEMPRDRYREHCVALRLFIDRWSARGNRVVVSCRALDYGDELHGLQRVEVQPLDDDKIRQFIVNELPHNWHAFWHALTDSDGPRCLLEMARNPYMLTVMIDVFVADGKLLKNRAELMHRFVGILLGWAKSKSGAPEQINVDVQRAALSIMAFEMQQRSGFGTFVKTGDVKSIIPKLIEITPGWPSQPCAADELLSIAAGAKIVEMPVDRSRVRFYHQLLQEFFAAQHILKLEPAQTAALWRWPWFGDEMPGWNRPTNNFEPLPPPPPTGWEETTTLAAGLATADRNKFVAAIERVNPVLAARCVLRGVDVAPSVRTQVLNGLLSAIADPKVALRARIVAGEALGQLGDPRLGTLTIVPSGKFFMGEGRDRHEVSLPEYAIGSYPVTNDEFARFIVANGYADSSYWTEAGWQEVGKDRDLPRFWENARFNKPNQPIGNLE